MQINERTLTRLLFVGMVGIVLLMALALGGYNTLYLSLDQEAHLKRTEAEQLGRQEAVLRSETEALTDFIRFSRSRTEEVLKRAIRHQTETAHRVAQTLWEREKGRRSDAEIKRLIIETLRPLRFFDGRGYVFIDDAQGRCILLPTAPEKEGASLWDNRDDTGHYIMRGLVEATHNPQGAGFSKYRWYSPDSPRQMRDKIAFVSRFAPYDWVIGTGDYLHQVESDLQQEALARVMARSFGQGGRIAVYRRLPDDDIEILSDPLGMLTHLRLSALAADHPAAAMARRFVGQASREGALMRFSVTMPDGREEHRVALATALGEWDWITVSSVSLNEEDVALQAQRAEADGDTWHIARTNLVIGGAALLVSLLFALAYSRWMGGLLAGYQRSLREQNAALAESAEQQVLAATVFRSSQEAIFVADAERRILDVNPAFERLTGFSREEVIGRSPSILSSGRHSREFYASLWHTLITQGSWTGEIWNRRKDGSIYPEWQNITAVCNPAGEVTHYIATFSDVTERKDAEKRLRQMAEYDALTALPNRHLLTDRASQAIPTARRAGHALALMFLDLDRFKTINDSLGHAIGDRLLTTIAERLRQTVRTEDTVSRIGGDEFVVLLPRIEHDDDAGRVAEKLIERISAPMDIDGQTLAVTTSIGIALFPNDGEDVSTLMKHADAAMYYAKELGRNNFQFFTHELNARIQARFAREKELRQAIEHGEFRLFYQPQIALVSRQIVGCEALLRWQHPTLGLLPPGEFIEIAEECGLIEAIGDWVLEEACRQAAQWRHDGLPALRMGVNVSPNQLRNRNIVARVLDILARTGLPGDALELEITENLLVNRSAQLDMQLAELSEYGVRLALDDFGTGYSNLSYLKRFPIHRLKIDRSFVSDIPHDALDATLTTAIAGLADNFGLATIAEGVETAEQYEFLMELGCDEAQGYFFHAPMSAEDMRSVLVEQMRRAVSATPSR